MANPVRRQCNLCEAGCGLVMDVEGNEIVSVSPDHDDPISRGYVCPKGMAIAAIHHDPDRLRRPMKRATDGSFHEISWDEAFDEVASRLIDIRKRHGADAIGAYFGNPMVHNYSGILLLSAFMDAIGTRNRTSAGSQDTSPRFATSYYLYGNTLVMPSPDIDRTDYFLCIGANPAVSQGSAMVTPDVKSRIKAIRARGGKVVTVDPRFTETSKLADDHVSIRPGTDAAFLLAMLNVLVAEGRVDRQGVSAVASGWGKLEPRLAAFTPDRVAATTGVDAGTIRRIALEFADAAAGVVYTRVGTCNSEFGTLATWANDLLNLAAGRLGKAGGWMFALPCLDTATIGELGGMNGHARWHSRVRGLPETGCDLPASILAEEIETPGDGQIRALITLAGNPVLSTPNGGRLAGALGRLEFQVAIDLYINETTRHADIILPPSWALTEYHTEPLTPIFDLRSGLRLSPPAIEKGEGERADWEIMLEIARRLGGGPTGMKVLDTIFGVAARFGFRFDPRKALGLMLRLGPHGDRFVPWKKGLTLAQVEASPYGADLGPAPEGIKHRMFHKDGKVHIDAGPFFEAMDDLERDIERRAGSGHDAGDLLLIGRRELRTCNSWMHNVEAMVSGRERCVLYVNPADAERAGLRDSQPAELESRVHTGEVPVRVTDEVMQGVVSLPHGWGHKASAPWQSVAGVHAGVSANDWTDDQRVEGIVGQSILNGVPVKLRPARSARRAA